MRTIVIILCFFLVCTGSGGQTKFPDMIRLEYNIYKSDGGVSIYNTRIGGNKVFTLGDFHLGIGADLHKFDLDHTYTSREREGVRFAETYVLRPEVSLTYLLGDNWSFTVFVRPEMASDFRGDWTREGFNISYGGQVTRSWYHTGGAVSSLVGGLEYSTAFGKPGLVPILNYSRKINDHWSYAAGYPHTWLAYTVNSRHTIRPLLDLDAFYTGVNAVTDHFEQGNDILYRLNYLNINGRVDYEYYFNRGWNLVAGLGYSVYNELALYREGHKEYTYDTATAPYVSLGINYNF